MTPLDRLLGAVKTLHESDPTLSGFAPWPGDLASPTGAPVTCPVAQTLPRMKLPGTRRTAPVIRALRTAAPHMEWRRTYTEAEVGSRFLDTYGYVELFGPNGHYRSQELRGYLGFWGPDLTYDWHAHEAEELYFTLSGRAVFSAGGGGNAMMSPETARQHASFQPHLMITLDKPYLAYALWRGPGIAGLPAMIEANAAATIASAETPPGAL
ncbi:MAG: dimethylsulfonioproprionate lyase family protein [Pseudomonadota bacterium]